MLDKRYGGRRKCKQLLFFSCLTILTFLFGLLSGAEPVSAEANTGSIMKAESLEIRTGFPGGVFSPVKTYQLADLVSLGQVQQAYSLLDNLPSPVIDSAAGVKLSDILMDSGIDVNKVQTFAFWSTDSGDRPYASLSKQYLLDTPRYYFPHWADDWTTNDTGGIVFPDPTAAAAGAIQVPTLIALTDNWQRLYTPLQPDFSVKDDSGRFRLVFGKTNDLAAAAPEYTAAKSIKWIYRIDVTLNGTAVSGVGLNRSKETLTPGGSDQLKVSITPSNASNRKVIWSVDNPAVAAVDENGLVRGMALGSAMITATTVDGGYSASCAVQVVSVQPVLTKLNLSGNPKITYGGTVTSYDLRGLTLNGLDQNGEDYDLTGQTVTWTVRSGPAALQQDTDVLIISGRGTINLTAAVNGVTSNILALNVQESGSVLSKLTLSGSPNLSYGGELVAYDLRGLNLSGQDQNGQNFPLSGQVPEWRLVSGPAVITDNTLTIKGCDTIKLTVTINGVVSNTLALDVVPAVQPRAIILSLTGDPQTSETVSWQTIEPVPETLQYLPTVDYKSSFSGATSLQASETDLFADTYHMEATLNGLSPNTSYTYRVGREGCWSEPAAFTTAAPSNPFSFLYMGDVQTGFEGWEGLLNAAAAESAQPKFALLGGDLVNDGTNSAQWEQFMDAAAPTFSQIPLMPINGNHDDSASFRNIFALPQNGPAAYLEQAYSFDYGNCHFVGLNCNLLTAPGTASYDSISTWLKDDLKNSTKEWKIVFFHYPPYPVVSDSHVQTLQTYWVPILEEGRVNVVFDGHQHIYMRTKPLKGGQITTDGKGIVYVMGNAGGEGFAPGPEYDYIAQEIAYDSNYELVTINGDTFSLIVKDVKGQVLDSCSLTAPASSEHPVYALTPVADTAYTIGATSEGIETMTVNGGINGLKYFTVSVSPIKPHSGTETVVFVHLRDGIQLGLNTVKEDFDTVNSAAAGFDVQAGDVVKAYIVDDLSSALDFNPTIFK